MKWHLTWEDDTDTHAMNVCKKKKITVSTNILFEACCIILG